MKRVVWMIVACSSCLLAEAQRDTFKQFSNDYFVETGSYLGDGIDLALSAGFKHVYSIELASVYYHHCRNRFNNDSRVEIFLGDSAEILYDIIKNIHAPITFWLDGHYSSGDTAKGKTNSPILQELNAIGRHPIKQHTILIDDIRQLGTSDFDGVTLDDLLTAIYAINPAYQVTFVDGYTKNDILVAQTKGLN